jgi:hypothetical protein
MHINLYGSNGVYWMPVWVVLQNEFEQMLVNSQHQGGSGAKDRYQGLRVEPSCCNTVCAKAAWFHRRPFRGCSTEPGIGRS